MTGPGVLPPGGWRTGHGCHRLDVLGHAGWASAYAVMAWLGGLTRTQDSAISLVWPAAGVGFLWVLHGSTRRRGPWPECLMLAGVAGVLNGVTGAPWTLACAIGPINAIQAAVSAWVFWKVHGNRRMRLSDVRGLQALLAAALAGALSAAPLAGLAINLVMHAPFLPSAGQWVPRNAVSTVVVASVGLVDLLGRRPWRVSRATVGEVAAFTVATGLLFGWVFSTPWGRPFAFMVLLLTVWSGLRLGLRITTLHLVVCGSAATLLTVNGSGPFGHVQPPTVRVSAVQAFVGVVSVVGLGLALSRRAWLALDRANERSALLGTVARVLSESLDLDRVLGRFGGLVVPRFADHCVVDLIGLDGRLCREILVHTPGYGPDGWTPVGQDPAYPASHPAAQALTSDRGRIVAIRTPDTRGSFPAARPAVPATQVALASALVVPLVARGHTIGVVSFASSVGNRIYGTDDLALATQLADRAAVAIDNARLYRHQQEVSWTLQRSLMPDTLPTAPGVCVAARYVAATEGSEVGGDWYDLVPMPTGRVAIIIGDVMGRGVAAAALMGQVRAALRAYAGQDLPPAEVLTHANELIRGLADNTIVTCVYCVYDPREEQLVLSNAGHVPPCSWISRPVPHPGTPPRASPGSTSADRHWARPGQSRTATSPSICQPNRSSPCTPMGWSNPANQISRTASAFWRRNCGTPG